MIKKLITNLVDFFLKSMYNRFVSNRGSLLFLTFNLLISKNNTVRYNHTIIR